MVRTILAMTGSTVVAMLIIFASVDIAKALSIVYFQGTAADEVAYIDSSSGVSWSPLETSGFIDGSSDISAARMVLMSTSTFAFDLLISCHTTAGDFVCPTWTNASWTGTEYKGLVLRGTSTPSKDVVNFDVTMASSSAPFDSATQYLTITLFPKLEGNLGGYTGTRIYGTNDLNSQCSTSGANTCSNANSNTPTLDLYAALQGADPEGGASYFINNNSPAHLASLGTTAVTLVYDFYNAGVEGFDRATVILKNQTTAAYVFVPVSVIPSTGVLNFSQDMTLQADTIYEWTPFVYSSASSSVNMSGWTDAFSTQSDFNWSDSQILGGQGLLSGESVLTEGNASSTLYGQLHSGFAVVDVLSTKFPINWAIGFGQVLSDLELLSATTSLPEMTVDFGYLHTVQRIATTSGPINWSVKYLGAETFYDVADFAPIVLARSMASGILWILLVMFAMGEAYSIFSGGRRRVFEQNIDVQGDASFKSWHRNS